LGHPPFGHNGEKALDGWAAGIGGFEGNAQTLRLLTRIEPKVFVQGRSVGLNLTRASLDATCKYPWARTEASTEAGADHSIKFGVYEDDRPVFDWLRQGAPARQKSVEAQVMDFSDDVAYSVHDFEDAVVSGFVNLAELSDTSRESELLSKISDWNGATISQDRLAGALADLRRNEYWLTSFDGSAFAQGTLKNLTSSLIGRFVSRTTEAIVDASSADSMARFGAVLVVPESVKTEIAVLKGIVSAFLMSHESRRPFYEWQRAILIELCDALLNANGSHLDEYSAGAWSQAKTEQEHRRVIVDQVACLTDQSALALHNRLVSNNR
jgi:dGTPase